MGGEAVRAETAFLIGGRHREDVLVRLPDGRLQVFPVSFDADRAATFSPIVELAGGNAPPPDSIDFWTRVGRNADVACYGCHATGQVLDAGTRSPTGLVLPASRFVEPGVGCEGCHGPGGPHVDAARAGTPQTASPRLGSKARGTQQVAACAACHALREVLPSPFSSAPAHRYGEPLTLAADPAISIPSNFEFRDPFFEDLRPATYQQEAVAFGQSGCARRGGLDCSACHDPHSGAPTPALAAADGGDAICTPCHAAIVARGTSHTRHAPGDAAGRCLACHMAPVLRGPASAPARDHSMTAPGDPRRARIASAVRAMSAGRTSGLAELGAIAADSDQPWFVRWGALQRLALPPGAPAPQAARAAAVSALADADPALRRAAARALGRIGDARDAEALLRASSDDDPWTALESTRSLSILGAPAAGGRMLQILRRPDLMADARAQLAYGHACLVGQDLAGAEKALRTALELNPLLLPAMNDLGLTLMGAGRPDDARTIWRNALDVNPRYTLAKENLERLESGTGPLPPR